MAAVIPPRIGPKKESHKFCIRPKTIFDPKDLAGFMLEPVKGMANKWQVVMDKPIAKGADPLTLGVLLSSAAEAKTTNTKTKVMKNSMPNPCPTLMGTSVTTSLIVTL